MSLKRCSVLFPVHNAQKMERFFCDILEFTKIQEFSREEGKYCTLRLGNEQVYLFEPHEKGKPYPEDVRGNDLYFQHIAIVVSDMNKAYQKVAHLKGISESPQVIPEWNTPAAGIQAYYFRSPEGHPLELIYFPRGLGLECWQAKTGLFLGIDHTAITISNTEKSLKFYASLGLKKVGESTNYGITQEKLSGVPGAKVHITGLRFEGTMGLEFLEYLEPQGGRPAPKEMQTNDLAAVCTVLEGKEKPKLLIDPDGHRIILGVL